MKKRLECIASHVPDGIGMIDVGTDHGYLPVALARRGYPGALYASDINAGPLAAARRSAAEAGLSGRIEFQLCDGLDRCAPESVDCIVIAGMGGDTICGILDRAEFCMDPRYTLVLQPMTRAEVLRYWLVYNEFEIAAEDIAEEGGTLYTVLVARFGGVTRLNEAELFTGSFAQIREHPLGRRMIGVQLARFNGVLAALERSGAGIGDGRQTLTRLIRDQLEEMENAYRI